MAFLPILWTGAKWLGGAVVSGLIGEWVADKVTEQTQPEISLDEGATQILVIGGLVVIVTYIFTITLITFKKDRK